MKWYLALALAVAVGAAAYSAGLGSEAAYILRSVVRHLVLSS